MASTGATALVAGARGRFRDGEGEGGAGAAALLEDEDATAAAATGDAAEGEAAAAAAAAAEAAGEADLTWATGVSAEAGEGKDTSNLDWLKGTKVKDLDSLVTIARDNQKALRESGRIKIPAADAKPEELAAYREALGVPDKPEGYEVKLPDGLEAKFELDAAVIDPLREVALANNVPNAAFVALTGAFMEGMAESAIATAAAADQTRDAKVKEWGPEAPARKEEFRRGAKVLGLDVAGIGRIQSGFGVGETMDLIAKIGNMAGEDFFATGDAAQRFGVADLESAKKALDAIDTDAANRNKLNKNHAEFDKALVAKRSRLIAAVAHYRELEGKK